VISTNYLGTSRW